MFSPMSISLSLRAKKQNGTEQQHSAETFKIGCLRARCSADMRVRNAQCALNYQLSNFLFIYLFI